MSNRNKEIYETKWFILDKPYSPCLKTVVKKLGWWLKSGCYRILLCLAKQSVKTEENSSKVYKVSICAIFKDEGEFLKEWIEYHRIVGIDHFYMYNNNSTDNYCEVLAPYIDEGIVTLINWPYHQAQMEAYMNAVEQYSKETKWLGFIDLDEFVVPLKEHKTVYDVLKDYEKKAGSVLIYWKCFGSSGLVERDRKKLVTEQFTLAYPKYVDIGKCFYNTYFEFGGESKKNSILHHWFWCKWKSHYFPPVNIQGRLAFWDHEILRDDDLPIQINHYVTKSYDDYYRKTNKKSDVYYKINPRKMENFYSIDRWSSVPDYSIFRFMVLLKSSMRNTDMASKMFFQ